MKISSRAGLAALLLWACVFSPAPAASKPTVVKKKIVAAPQTHAAMLRRMASSKKKLLETAADHNLAPSFTAASGTDTIHVIALRIEFNNGVKDTSAIICGNGLFGIRLGGNPAETKYYNSDTVYKYDALPHDSAYFDHQLQYVRNYYANVSHGKLCVEYSIYPPGSGEEQSYKVPLSMTAYGPGAKIPSETYAQYDERSNIRLIRFVRDALHGADIDSRSPFKSLTVDPNGNITDSLGHRCVFLIIHAGASYLTDGGAQGAAAANYTADMIDAFVSQGFFQYYKDSLHLDSLLPPLPDTAGITVNCKNGRSLIDEVMMTSETSNQDGLNFGIHGLMVNQLARQIGIPDLFSTSSGETAVGEFCIMDFYGYSAGQGFIPPWPSAWVRAFMGWETPAVAPLGVQERFGLRAVCNGNGQPGDTTLLFVPINDHEYYLLENRQRSLIGGSPIFNYDTVDNTVSIDPSYPLNLAKNVVQTSADASRCILSVKNYDASLPASGVVVWHIDENVIRDRLRYDLLNADSSYRAISVVQASGVSNLGVEYQDALGNTSYDAGSEEDVFPHFTLKTSPDSACFVDSMGPWTSPSTAANDGGQTYLQIGVDTLGSAGKEVAGVNGYYVTDFVDSVVSVSVGFDYLARGWPKLTAPDSFFEPAVCSLSTGNGARAAQVALLSGSGKLYLWPADSSGAAFGDTVMAVPYTGAINRSLHNSPATVPLDSIAVDTVRCYRMPGAFTFPTVINGRLLIPSKDSSIYIISALSPSPAPLVKTSLRMPQAAPSTYVCRLAGNLCAVGCANGTVVLADTAGDMSVTRIKTLPADSSGAASPVCAVAALAGQPGCFACIQNDGRLSVYLADKDSLWGVKVPRGIAPYFLVTGDINHDSVNEIVVCDSRKGLWAYEENLTPAAGWGSGPNDWASLSDTASRAALPVNPAPPALADINHDGRLDIIVGGTNGLYALNYKGNLISGWPSYLDNRYNHGAVACSPAVVGAPLNGPSPLVLYTTPSGANATFEIDTILSANKASGEIVFRRNSGQIDSTTASASFIDSALVMGGSLVFPFMLPGGLVDAVNPSGKRPVFTIGNNPINSRWPLTIGSPGATSPLLENIAGDGKIDMIAVSQTGWVYRWRLGPDMVGDSLIWQQAGYDAGRPFAYLAGTPSNTATETAALSFFSYPNPTNGSKSVAFKYKFSGPATSARLDIFTYTGYHVFSQSNLSGSYPDWNELSPVSLANFAAGVYRCRFSAVVNGKKAVQYWKMAVVK